jgi:hypothetical protein
MQRHIYNNNSRPFAFVPIKHHERLFTALALLLFSICLAISDSSTSRTPEVRRPSCKPTRFFRARSRIGVIHSGLDRAFGTFRNLKKSGVPSSRVRFAEARKPPQSKSKDGDIICPTHFAILLPMKNRYGLACDIDVG